MSSQLKAKLGLFSAVMVVVSAMIGSGVFKKVSLMSNDLHSSAWVLGAWLCAGLITLMGSLSNAEVAGLIAKPGGQYVYFQKMYGKLFAFLYGWSSFSVIQTATAASVAYVFAESFNRLFPLPILSEYWSNYTLLTIADFQLQPFHNFGVKMMACGLIVFLSIINYKGISYGEKIGNILGGLVVVGLLLIVFFAFTHSVNPNPFSLKSSSFQPVKVSVFFSAMMAAFWAFEGWNNVGFLGGEIKNPKRNIPIALFVGTLIVMTLYFFVNMSYFKMTDIVFFEAILKKENAIAAVESISTIWVTGGMLISVLILVSTFNSTNNSIMTSPRIYYAMANDGLFLKSAGKTHPKYSTPHRSIVYQMCWCMLLVMSGSFDMLTEMLVFVAFIFYGCGAFGVIVLRYKMPNDERPFKVPFYPVLPLFFTLFSAFLVAYSIKESPGNAIVGLLLLSLGLPMYFYMKFRNK
jgi:APA family basic amino acid/polyamine antiporter